MQENLILTESKLPQADSITRQEYVDHITRQVNYSIFDMCLELCLFLSSGDAS